MNKNYTTKKSSRFLSLLLVLFVSTTYGQTLVHYWNFNNSASIATITAPSQTLGGAALNAIPGGISVIDFANGTGQNFNVLNLNTRNSDASGTHLRFNDPIGGALEFTLPTTGYENCIVKFASRRSGSGAGTQVWSYSIDGTNYISFSNVIPNNGDPALATLDFSGIDATDNNPNFKLKVEFQQGSGGTVGNNRFDNFTLEGTTFGGADVIAPLATLFPLNNATNVATNVVPTISFNEAIRLADNSVIDNNNVDAVVELRLNNVAGTIVPFDATISGNVISITPLSSLTVNQTYYIALLPNTVEDLNDNVITTTQSGIFTTANPSISFVSNFIIVNENQGTLSLVLNIANPATSLVDLVVKSAPFSTADNSDFILASQTIFITESSPATLTITIPIIDDSLEEQHSEYFVLSLESPS